MLRVGVIGCGMVARVGHLPFLKRNPRVSLVAAADPQPTALRRIARKYDIPRTFTDPLELLELAELDAVVIASPHWAHAEQAVRAAQRGLHILLEKPVTTTLADCERIEQAVNAAGVVCQVATQKRFHWAFQRAKQMIEAGELGKVFQITVDWYHAIPDLSLPWIQKGIKILNRFGIDLERKYGAWRLNDERAGGGDFLDHGPHYLDLMRFLLGEIERQHAETARVYPSRVHEDHAAALLRFQNGAIGSFVRGQSIVARPYGFEHCYIHGTKGSLFIDSPHEYTLRSARLYRTTMRNLVLNRGTRLRPPWGFDRISYRRQSNVFVAHALNSYGSELNFPREWIPSLRDGREALAWVLRAYDSAQA